MTDERLRADWDVASSMMALVANVFRGKDSSAKRPQDFHPFYAERERIVEDTKQAFATMKRLWGGKEARRGKRNSA